jgi:hypothetical protein
MIKFFRKIRQTLLSQGKTGKYLKYAIGEIFLVVIGILIALQINNWNKEFQNSKLEKLTLQNLKADLVLQKDIIQIQLKNEKKYITYVDSCTMALKGDFDIKSLVNQLDVLSERRTFTANTITFDNLRLDGNESLIKNSELQNEIIKYYKLLDYTKSVVNNNNLYRVNSQFGNFVVNNDLGFRLNNEGELDINYSLSPEQRFTLKKQLESRRYSSTNNMDKCINQLEYTEYLIELIDKELNRK